MGNASLLLAKNFCSLMISPSSFTFSSSSFAACSFRTVVNNTFVFQMRQRLILQSLPRSLICALLLKLRFVSSHGPILILPLHWTTALLVSSPQTLCLSEVLKPILFMTTLIPASYRMETKDLPLIECLKLNITQETSQGSYCSFCCIQTQDCVVEWMGPS